MNKRSGLLNRALLFFKMAVKYTLAIFARYIIEGI